MSTEIATPTSTSLAQPDTTRETKIGWREYEKGIWTKSHANEYWPADYLYSRKGKFYQHLDEIDQGLKNGYTWWNQPYFTHLANRDLITIFADNLELTPSQKRLAVAFFLDQDLQKWGIRKELVLWATCAYIVHQDEADDRRCHPRTKEEDKDKQFLEAAHSLDLRFKDREGTYGKVQNRLPL